MISSSQLPNGCQQCCFRSNLFKKNKPICTHNCNDMHSKIRPGWYQPGPQEDDWRRRMCRTDLRSRTFRRIQSEEDERLNVRECIEQCLQRGGVDSGDGGDGRTVFFSKLNLVNAFLLYGEWPNRRGQSHSIYVSHSCNVITCNLCIVLSLSCNK